MNASTLYSTCLMFLLGISTLHADDSNCRSYFKYPDVRIKMDFGTGVGHAEAVPFQNHANPVTSPGDFQSGAQMSGNRPDNPQVHWRFMGKTETGDLYLIAIYQKEQLIKELPVLYTGSDLIAYDRDRIKVTFERWSVDRGSD